MNSYVTAPHELLASNSLQFLTAIDKLCPLSDLSRLLFLSLFLLRAPSLIKI